MIFVQKNKLNIKDNVALVKLKNKVIVKLSCNFGCVYLIFIEL